MNVDSIKNGIVIDHITAGLGMRVYSLLGLDRLDCPVAIIKNVASRKMGKKDIIKVLRVSKDSRDLSVVWW
jgi:aspartate carbamoyltransferase regulatory subunit